MGICVGYLPPSNSSRGNQTQEFFDTLKSLIIDNYHLGPFLICGDFNARCGNLPDISSDSVPKRAAIDLTVNQAGRELTDTLRALQLCILNGRFSNANDGFTSVY